MDKFPEATNSGITNDPLGLIMHLAKLRRPEVCRHWVALEIIGLLEARGEVIPDGLTEAVSDSSEGDERVAALISGLLTRLPVQ